VRGGRDMHVKEVRKQDEKNQRRCDFKPKSRDASWLLVAIYTSRGGLGGGRENGGLERPFNRP